LFFRNGGCILWAWDTSGFLRARLADLFNFTVVMGSLKLNVKGIILAVGILYITRFAVRIGRSLLKEKILDRRSLEIGLKDSILTITSYLGWALGLLLALGIIGVNATSLAVIFGGLSIGIGFGMQTISTIFSAV
jgi:potassium-dependent mechanosensitive channel